MLKPKQPILCGITSIGEWAFANCSNVTEVEVASTVERIGANAFRSCTGIEYIVLPIEMTQIGDSAFILSAVFLFANKNIKCLQ